MWEWISRNWIERAAKLVESVCFPVNIRPAIEPVFRFAGQPGNRANCPACGGRVEAAFLRCPECGFQLKINCPECGKIVETDRVNCPFCKIALRPRPIPGRSLVHPGRGAETRG
ncbi:MAG: hypothetical protein HOC74_31360 [Gemmatimonadetes bacterium]|nr:hypothetical protein [Gemmatimonadota bacterium]